MNSYSSWFFAVEFNKGASSKNRISVGKIVEGTTAGLPPEQQVERLMSMQRCWSFISNHMFKMLPTPCGLLLSLLLLCEVACSAGQDAEQRAGQANHVSVSAGNTSDHEAASSELAIQILHRSLMESVWGKPVLCEVRQNIRMFDKKRSSFGKYVRGGQGSGKMRLSLQVPAGDQMNSLLQVGDGELLSTLLDVGELSTRTQIDLGKIRDRLTITARSLQDPVMAIYLAVGGQAELLRKLCQQYKWTSVAEGRLAECSVWWLRGEAVQEPPPVHGLAPIDVRLFDERTGLSPHKVTVAIGHLESEVPFWLYHVEETYQDIKTASSQLNVLTEWDAPVPLTPAQLVPDLFRLSISDSQTLYESRDETKLYLPPAQSSVADRTQLDTLR